MVRVEHGDRFGRHRHRPAAPLEAAQQKTDLVSSAATCSPTCSWLTDPGELGRCSVRGCSTRPDQPWGLVVGGAVPRRARRADPRGGARFVPGGHGVQQLGRWLVVAGVGMAVDAIVLGLVVVVIVRVGVFRSLAYTGPATVVRTRTNLRGRRARCCAPGLRRVRDRPHPPPRAHAARTRPASTRAAVAVRRCSKARREGPGCRPSSGASLRRSWVELDTERGLEARLVVARSSPLPGTSRAERLRRATCSGTGCGCCRWSRSAVCRVERPGRSSTWTCRHGRGAIALRRLAAALALVVATLGVLPR